MIVGNTNGVRCFKLPYLRKTLEGSQNPHFVPEMVRASEPGYSE
jgi:hypothetical protein